jgi:hypothetical protein
MQILYLLEIRFESSTNHLILFGTVATFVLSDQNTPQNIHCCIRVAHLPIKSPSALYNHLTAGSW